MKNFISQRFAIYGFLIILSLVVIFHLLIMFSVIPFEIVWGGRLKYKSQMLVFETASVIINLLMLTVVMIKAEILNVRINRMIIKIALWIMFGLFFINTFSNLFSKNDFEKVVFAPLTLILLIFCLRLAISQNKLAGAQSIN